MQHVKPVHRDDELADLEDREKASPESRGGPRRGRCASVTATRMDRRLSHGAKRVRWERQTGCGIAHGWGLKKAQKSLPPKQQQRHRCRKQTYGYQGVRGGGIKWEVGTNAHTGLYRGFPSALVVKNLPASAGATGHWGRIPGSGRPPAGGGNPLQCSCLEKPLGRGAWWAIVHRATKSQTQLKLLGTIILIK